MNEEEIDLLLSKYFSGDASPEELQQLTQWLSQSAENEKYFEEMTTLFQLTNLPDKVPVPDTQESLRVFKTYTEQNPKNKQYNPRLTQRWIYSGVAAIVLVLIGIFTFFKIDESQTIQFAAENQIEYVVIEDIGEVSLETGAKIVYHKKKKNEIELTGKAKFVVKASEREEKLTVFAGETKIKDIGTVFTVSANKGEVVSVEVEEGLVQFYTDNNPGLMVAAGEIGEYNPATKEFVLIEKEIQPINIDQDNEIDEIENIIPNDLEESDLKQEMTEEVDVQEITFKSVPLREVVEQLQQQFKVAILFADPAIGEMTITTGFMPNDSIDNILWIITRTLSLQFIKNEETYIISL
ncbi:DUF4974 domain-containing protein [Bacteroidales bacterium OttesenSCG-928-B11]|nr:DUF4974 domain-containing protein [Bacteroidales bacterium OttesenSCG-928-B11]MDL2325917.1 DUF4974 domain-containing protein [Bacteroidales bacterium OttesenSCG-928-A14]